MAHPNIHERQAHVKRLLGRGVVFTLALRKELAELYSCSRSALHADLIYLTRPRTNHSIYTSAGMRKAIRCRDGNVCQYCGTEPEIECIVEHIIPAALGGEARAYNLVMACNSCNVRKGRRVWLPRNLIEITEDHAEWRERILSLADATSPGLSARQGAVNGRSV